MTQPPTLSLDPIFDADRASPVSESDSLFDYLPASQRHTTTEAQTSPSPKWRLRDVPIYSVDDHSNDEGDRPQVDGDVKPIVPNPKYKRKAATSSLSPFNSENERLLDELLTSAAPTTPQQSPTANQPYPTPASSSPLGQSSTPKRSAQTARTTPIKRAKVATAATSPSPTTTEGLPKKQGPFSPEEDLAIFRHLLSGAPASALAPKLNRLNNAVATRSKLVIRDCEAMLAKKRK